MSKDSRYSFPERLKRWLKSECGNVPLNQHITLTEELRAELSSKSPASTRIKAIKELDELMSTRKLEENGIESVWHLVQDLLGCDCPSEQRHVTLQMLTTLTTAHEDMGFDFFCGVIAEGRHLEYIEEFVGSFLLDWLPAVLASPQTLDALHVIINLVKFNSAFLDEVVIMGYVK
ncbi:tuberin-like [Panulirus ornatus]|uniref:tuberin-like n=1 Tax=Panulirus ornatus TaxID=150431 RepID=UPI003A851197